MIEIYLRNGKHFKLIESFIAEEDDELYHSLIDQEDVTMLLQDTVLQSLKYGDVFLNSIILNIDKGLTVKDWVEKHKDKIELFFLPSDSPERNPDEYLNCDVKQGLSQKKSPKTQEQLKYNLLSHMNMLLHNPDRVKKYFKHKDIQYAA